MAIDARLRLRLRRNEARALPVRIIGMAGFQLRSAAPYMQVRDGLDVPGPPRIALAAIADDNVDGLGLRVVDLDPVDGKPACLLVIQVDKATADDADALPYAALGETREMRWALAWNGQQRLGGVLEVLGAVIGADNAPADRELSYGAAAQGGGLLDAGATVTIAGDEVVELVIDGAGELGPLLEQSEGAAARAVDAAARTEALASTSYRAVETYGDREAIPLEQRGNGMVVNVRQAYSDEDDRPVARDFVWNTDLFMPGGWEGKRTDRELNAQLDARFGAVDQVDANLIKAISANAALRIVDARVALGADEADTEIGWAVDGAPPRAQRVTFAGRSIDVDGGCRSLRSRYWRRPAGLLAISDSMLHNGIPAKVAAAIGIADDQLRNASLYSAGARMVYRVGAKPLYVTLTHDTLPAAGTSVIITAINDAAPGSANPASPLWTGAGDTNVHSLSGTILGERVTMTAAGGGGTYRLGGRPAGAAPLHVPPGTLFVPDFAARLETDVVMIRLSQNYVMSESPEHPDHINPQVLKDIDLIVRRTRGNPVLIGGLTPDRSWVEGTWQYTAVRAFNAMLRARYTAAPVVYVLDNQGRDTLARLVGADGIVPVELLRANDTLHLNEDGEAIEAGGWAEAYRRLLPVPAITADTPVAITAESDNGLGSALVASAVVQGKPSAVSEAIRALPVQRASGGARALTFVDKRRRILGHLSGDGRRWTMAGAVTEALVGRARLRSARAVAGIDLHDDGRVGLAGVRYVETKQAGVIRRVLGARRRVVELLTGSTWTAHGFTVRATATGTRLEGPSGQLIATVPTRGAPVFAGVTAGGGAVRRGDTYVRGPELLPVLPDMARIAGWGSSTMAFLADNLAAMATPLGAAYHDGGKGGERVEHTTARLGSHPAALTFPAGVIPASGAISVTVAGWEGFSSAVLKPFAGQVGGVAGTLAPDPADDRRCLFTRAVAGAETPVAEGSLFVPTDGTARRDAVTLLNLGKNNMGAPDSSAERIVALTAEAFDWLSPLVRRALVLGHFNNTTRSDGSPTVGTAEYERVRAVNRLLQPRYGAQFVDVGGFLTGARLFGRTVWEVTGVTPTADDLAAQANGVKPPSLSRDYAHLDERGDGAIAWLVRQHLLSLGYYSEA